MKQLNQYDERIPNNILFHWIDSRYSTEPKLGTIIKLKTTPDEREFILMLLQMPDSDRLEFRHELAKTVCIIPKMLFNKGE